MTVQRENKQRAQFETVLGCYGRGNKVSGDVVPGTRALLGEVTGHPILGNLPTVDTSMVLKVERNKDGAIVQIETLNTIYDLKV